MRKSNLSKSINLKVLLLCGGQGTRLHPLTKTIPKPLVRIKNKTIIDYIINHLKGYGLKNFLICSGYKSKMIENHFKNIKSINTKIINSGKVDILKRILDCKKMINDKFIICYETYVYG